MTNGRKSVLGFLLVREPDLSFLFLGSQFCPEIILWIIFLYVHHMRVQIQYDLEISSTFLVSRSNVANYGLDLA